MVEIEQNLAKEILLRQKVKEILALEDSGHDFGHAVNTYENAKKIVEAEGGNFDIIGPAALVHDIGRINEGKNGMIHYEQDGLDIIESVLCNCGYSSEEIVSILDIVKDHDRTLGVKVDTLSHNAKILIDADNLDALGVEGLKRSFRYGARINEPLYLPDEECIISHIKKYHLNLEDIFTTETGKHMALPLLEEVKTFLMEFDNELNSLEEFYNDPEKVMGAIPFMEVFTKYNIAI